MPTSSRMEQMAADAAAAADINHALDGLPPPGLPPPHAHQPHDLHDVEPAPLHGANGEPPSMAHPNEHGVDDRKMPAAPPSTAEMIAELRRYLAEHNCFPTVDATDEAPCPAKLQLAQLCDDLRHSRLYPDGASVHLSAEDVQELDSFGFDWTAGGPGGVKSDDMYEADQRGQLHHEHYQNYRPEDFVNLQQPQEDHLDVKHEKYETFANRVETLRQYYLSNGHFRVKQSEDKSLSRFVSNVRYSKKHPDKGALKLSEERLEQLNAIGFDWNPGNTRGTSYIDRIHQLRRYKAEHGTLDTISYATNRDLNQFCAQLRKSYANMDSGRTSVRLDAARIAEINELGFDWTLNMGHDAVQKNRSFEERLQELKEFKARHGDLHVTSKQDKSLATFCKAVRYARRHPDKAKIKVGEDRVAALNDLGFIWEPKKGPGGGGGVTGQSSKPRKTFDDRYEELVAYKNEHGHIHTTNKMDRALASCVRKWRLARANPSPTGDSRTLTSEQIAKLNDLGMDWTVPPPKKRVKRQNKSFDERIEDLKEYAAKYGHADVIPSNDKSLSDFCNNVRYARKHPGKGISLTEERITQLEAVGFKWAAGTSVVKRRPRIQQSFSQRVDALRAYREKYGNVNIIRNVDPSLHSFCDNVRFGRSHPGKGMNISEERIRMLNEVGFDWKDSARPRLEGEVQRKAVVRKTFMERIEDLKAYRAEKGNMHVTRRDNQSLADFCSNVRQARRSQQEGNGTGPGIRLTEERIEALNAIGFDWEGKQKRATGLKRERR